MSLRLCVLLWARPGREYDVHAYEDQVLPLLEAHGGTLVARERVARQSDEEPTEVQIITLTSQAAMDSYMADPRRLSLEPEREAAIARTQILRLS